MENKLSKGIIEKAIKLLEMMKIDSSDKYNIGIAVEFINKTGSLRGAIDEVAMKKYDRFRYTPELLLYSATYEKEENNMDAEILTEKLYSLHRLILKESMSLGKEYDDILERVNVVESISLDSREAWAVKFAGGKGFIAKMTTYQSSKHVENLIASALKQADRHIKNQQNGIAISTSTGKLIGA